MPFARCQILPKVEEMEAERRQGNLGEGRRKEEEAKMMERPTSGRKEGRGSSHPEIVSPLVNFIEKLLGVSLVCPTASC